MPCTMDHSDPDNIPDFLCRACHPELNRKRADKPAERPKQPEESKAA